MINLSENYKRKLQELAGIISEIDPQSKQVQKRNDKFKAYIFKPNLADPAAAASGAQAAATQGQALFTENKKSYELYFETLAQALDEIENYARKNGYEIVDANKEFFQFGIGGISYGDTKRGSFNLTKDGNPIKRKIQVQIYRMDSGRYELNQYIA